MKSNTLSVLNAIGCVILTSVVVTLWTKERALDQALGKTKLELATANDQTAKEIQRVHDLERDVVALKESISATQAAVQKAEHLSAEQTTQTASLEAEILAAREQIKTWQIAIAERDTKLQDLNQDLAATRQRLDEAIQKLKAASAR